MICVELYEQGSGKVKMSKIPSKIRKKTYLCPQI